MKELKNEQLLRDKKLDDLQYLSTTTIHSKKTWTTTKATPKKNAKVKLEDRRQKIRQLKETMGIALSESEKEDVPPEEKPASRSTRNKPKRKGR